MWSKVHSHMLLVKHSVSLENNLTISSKMEDLLLSEEASCFWDGLWGNSSTCAQVDMYKDEFNII